MEERAADEGTSLTHQGEVYHSDCGRGGRAEESDAGDGANCLRDVVRDDGVEGNVGVPRDGDGHGKVGGFLEARAIGGENGDGHSRGKREMGVMIEVSAKGGEIVGCNAGKEGRGSVAVRERIRQSKRRINS